jgi:hypothetical protein
MLGNYQVAAQLVASPAVLSSTELVSQQWTLRQTINAENVRKHIIRKVLHI